MTWDATRGAARGFEHGTGKPYKDEVVVFVLSNLAQQTGSFTYPRHSTWILKLANGSNQGFYFAWNDDNDLDKNMGSPRIPGIDRLLPLPLIREKYENNP